MIIDDRRSSKKESVAQKKSTNENEKERTRTNNLKERRG